MDICLRIVVSVAFIILTETNVNCDKLHLLIDNEPLILIILKHWLPLKAIKAELERPDTG